MNTSTDSGDADVLNGWKEIANYLGRSTRSVQRWERDLGLPVRRISTSDDGASVYALRSELDAWRTQQDVAADRGGSGEAVAETLDATSPVAVSDVAERRSSGWHRLTRPVPVWSLFLVAVAAYWAGHAAWTPALFATAARWDFDGRQLHAFSEGGRLLWTHEFDRVVSRPNTLVRGIGVPFSFGTETQGALIPVRFAAVLDSTPASDAVFAFDRRGNVRWSIQPAMRMTVGTETFEGPWHVNDVVTGETAEGPRAWVAFSHHTWWPSFVVELDPAGRSTLRYVQSGRVHSLTYWKEGTRRLLVAGGTLQEAGRASAAFLDLDGRAYRWPVTGPGALQCDGCPADVPAALMTFPTSEVSKRMARPYGWVIRGRTLHEGLMLLINDGFGQGTMATLTADLEVSLVEHSDQYWNMHQELEREGRISHAVTDCPDLDEPLDVRKWSRGTGWSTTPVRLSRPGLPAAAGP